MENRLLHKATYKIVRILLMPYIKYSFGFEFEKFNSNNKPYIVLANHTNNFDPVLVAMSFPKHMYFVASEHIFRKGLLSKFIIRFIAPIMRVKAKTERRTAVNIIKTIRSGNNLCMFAEGSTSWNGETNQITPATIKLIKSSGASLITYRIEGGYLTMPRWSKTIKKGKSFGKVLHEYSAKELSNMTSEEIERAVSEDLYVNAFAVNEKLKVKYKGKKLAESLETVLYVCPNCKEIATLKSDDDILSCSCGLSLRYNTYGLFESTNSSDVPFKTILEWDKWQSSYIKNNVDYFKTMPLDKPILKDTNQSLYKFEAGKSTALIGGGNLYLYCDRLVLEDSISGKSTIFRLSDITDMALIMQTLLTFTIEGKNHYEIQSKIPRSSLKYLMICKNLTDIRTML